MIDYEFYYNMFVEDFKLHEERFRNNPNQNADFYQLLLMDFTAIQKMIDEMPEDVPTAIRKKYNKLVEEYQKIIVKDQTNSKNGLEGLEII